ncbi:hypothetical protein B0H34DRAFT_689499 [Crassisporium funariophilum]|nr:hypothetical protein B0H34DRAFT_689499 [Crassisporium funariophilum]
MSASQLSVGSSSTSALQDGSCQTYGCRWAWCRLTFSTNAELNKHVIHEHVHRAVPVRLQDIPMIRRAEEGMGESLRLSDLLRGSFSPNSRDNESSAKEVTDPSSSLPSPPASSPALHSPTPYTVPWLEPSQAPASPSVSEARHIGQGARSTHIIAIEPLSPPTHGPQLGQMQRAAHTTFASLSSPSESMTSFSIPNSPSFSSLVERPKKRKLGLNADNSPKKRGFFRPHARPRLSESSQSSLDSQNSVVQQLTQSLDMDLDELVGDEDAVGEEVSDFHQPLEDHILPDAQSPTMTPFEPQSEDDPYDGELQWNCSEHQSKSSDSEPHTQDRKYVASLDALSQPPSQFQLPLEFPRHIHDYAGPSSPKIPPPIETDLDSSVPMALSSPVPVVITPTFAASTPHPHRQNLWYQSSVVWKRNKKVDKSDRSEEQPNTSPATSPSQSNGANLHTPKSKYVFRSGTLEIDPASLLRPHSKNLKDSGDSVRRPTAQLDSQSQDVTISQESRYQMEASQPESYPDFSSESEGFSYPPLQTQAPYQSQDLTQL